VGTVSLVLGIALLGIGIILFFFTLYVHSTETIFDGDNEGYFIIIASLEVGLISGGACSIADYLKGRKKENPKNS
jgi:purine-cytosine permease-like protein